ncbi:DNA methyltransferase [uncultured Thiodictyon sp.]|uniref:class I SAM-dependent DNA methyltransferase n=1 Tax=uncultured Thiodictyon sp. TaxID=1846217 RepID=UPI0025FBC9C4|nr:DNA methyltransferase [uncultured Thiodictyon sp.]
MDDTPLPLVSDSLPLAPDDPPAADALAPALIDTFIARWSTATGTERANYQLFLTELCALLGLPQPDPARADGEDNAYCFERRVVFQHGDGTASLGFIDLYRRACYVLECKQTGLGLDTGGWDKAMLRAHGQAVQYVRALPPPEGRPPFVVVVDVGRSIELYSEFSRSGGAYIPYPDPRSHRLRLDDLRRPEIRARLRALWLDPGSLDPSRRAARVTRDIAERLARLAVSLESAGHPPEVTASFLIRCLFTLFAEDVGLLKPDGFTDLLRSVRGDPAQFVPLTEHLWRDMNTGAAFSVILRERVPRFNGGLFAQGQALPLDRDQLDLLIDAGRADWRQVEPAIFGTLLERALDPLERHRLGAHYTPRSYVERLVLPTVIDPLREEWTAVHSAAFNLHEQGKDAEAIKLVSAFQVRLAGIRVLDPACGSGNFLYVTLEHLKRLEGEVLDTLESLGQRQLLMAMEGISVDPHQLLGLELNPRAAAIAETVLWIGYLQWHFRTHGAVKPPEPVIRDFRNIECRDAVLDYDRMEWVTDEAGRPVTRWDGRTVKPSPITGEAVPDEAAQVPQERYVNPRRARWPAADFVVGNPPFIGAGPMRRALGDGYVEALRGAWSEVPESADYVMYWWENAAELTRTGALRRFGFITTNSLRQTFNRRVLERHLTAAEPLSLRYAVPDHPWVDAADGAQVRIGMTVGEAGESPGVVDQVVAERTGQGEGLEVDLERTAGRIHADLRIGADVTAAVALRANQGLSSPGVKLHGAGFIVTPLEAAALGLGRVPGLERHIRLYLNGRDLTQSRRGVMVIDLFGLTADEVRGRYPEVYQRVLERVKPERDAKGHTKDGAGYAALWWLHGKPRQELRRYLAGLPRYIATVETAKHRVFVFLDRSVLPDNMLIAIALDDAWALGVLSSRVHVCWALATGARLGVGNDPRYTKTRCFDTFPFPAPAGPEKEIGQLAEALDAHRKARQALHPGLTMTGMYNVLEQLRRGEPLGPKDRAIHEQGLVSVLRQLHDELDAAVLAAYGWADLTAALLATVGAAPRRDGPRSDSDAADRAGTALPPAESGSTGVEETILQRLVALNAERAAQERRGLIRWLRPALQNPGQPPGATAVQAETALTATPPASGPKPDWPKTLPEQFQALRAALTTRPGPNSVADLAQCFTRAPRARVAELLETLASLGHARRLEDGRYLPG